MSIEEIRSRVNYIISSYNTLDVGMVNIECDGKSV